MQNDHRLSVIVAAGGTGGDLFPVLSVIERLASIVADRSQFDVTFVGNPDRIEGRVIPIRGYRFVPIPMRGYYGLRSLRTYSMVWRLPVSVFHVYRAVRRLRPRVAILAGAYLSIPLGLVAKVSGIPIVLVEINAAPGKVNRLLAPWAHSILVSSNQCRTAFPPAVRDRIVVTGTPIRAEVLAGADASEARQHFGLAPDRPVLLVLGGSLGARSINDAIAQHLDRILATGWQVLWQTGSDYWHPHKDGVVALPFIEDMASAYAAATIVISRAGGSTVAELAALAKPAVLVPYPHAANREQHRNAALLEQSGGAIAVEDALLATKLWNILEPLLKDPKQPQQMATALQRYGQSDAADQAARTIAALLGQ
ncbi:MAG: UDP-N-acetylglucosamine--N-acetylmuramyl-(pentapeptide) pyrophosphoryl-undecaprenol N-acetylglucosamine transferase [Chlorobi bacterium]|nr:UDP-N-acetylglucosamine--N-acetylmuramyl-(pentapeptide) pyrophosphoryl-undecaprenol N-acetylglucosamine transferase [Chlorobiota bacterium]